MATIYQQPCPPQIRCQSNLISALFSLHNCLRPKLWFQLDRPSTHYRQPKIERKTQKMSSKPNIIICICMLELHNDLYCRKITPRQNYDEWNNINADSNMVLPFAVWRWVPYRYRSTHSLRSRARNSWTEVKCLQIRFRSIASHFYA